MTETRNAEGTLKLLSCLDRYHTLQKYRCGGVAANINFGWSWKVARDNSVGIATCYGANGSGIESR